MGQANLVQINKDSAVVKKTDETRNSSGKYV